MKRRTALAGVGVGFTGMIAGCFGSFSDDGGSDPPRLVGLQVGNWHPEPQTLNVHIEADDDRLYENQVRLAGGDSSEYDRPSRNLEDHPSDLPPSAVLSTWLNTSSKDYAYTLDLGNHSYEECVGVQLDICPECESQKGQADVTAPADPGILILTTSSCSYPGG
jgi:hypothetical protein